MNRMWILWVGDVTTILLVTLAGFATHGELPQAGGRILTTFVPLLAAWMVVGVPAKLFDLNLARQPRELWRPLWAMLLAGPLAVLLRALLLGGAPILPTFALVITGVACVAILLWRGLFCFGFRGKS